MFFLFLENCFSRAGCMESVRCRQLISTIWQITSRSVRSFLQCSLEGGLTHMNSSHTIVRNFCNLLLWFVLWALPLVSCRLPFSMTPTTERALLVVVNNMDSEKWYTCCTCGRRVTGLPIRRRIKRVAPAVAGSQGYPSAG